MFVTNENIHSHNTINKNGYLIPSVRTNCRKFTVGYAGPILWNSFSQKLRQLPSEVIFKKKLKSILLTLPLSGVNSRFFGAIPLSCFLLKMSRFFLGISRWKKCTQCGLLSVKWNSDDSATTFQWSAKLIRSAKV